MTAYRDVLDQMSALERSIWVARFWSKVDVGGPRECWFWSAAGSITDNGYGRVSRPDRHGNWMAHRVAYEPEPPNGWVRRRRVPAFVGPPSRHWPHGGADAAMG